MAIRKIENRRRQRQESAAVLSGKQHSCPSKSRVPLSIYRRNALAVERILAD
jgi:hypothetical protein